MRFSLAIVIALAPAACGEKDPAAPAPELGEATFEQVAADRVVVATVAGEPIYGDCIAAHVIRDSMTREDALAECIEFELLAQEAGRNGLLDKEAIEARNNEAVRQLIDETFYAEFDGPEDVDLATVKRLWDRGLEHYYNREENRTTFYCRAANPDENGKTPDGEPAERAKKLAEVLYAELRNRTDLTPETLQPICKRVAEDVGGAIIASAKFTTTFRGRAVVEYADATFAIPAVGQVSPPIRTAWGWDIILLVHVLPGATSTLEEATPKIQKQLFEDPKFEAYRRERFGKYLNAIVGKTPVERWDERLGRNEVAIGKPGK